MSTPRQMFDNELNPVKGWPSPYALDKVGDVADGEPVIESGSVVSFNSNGRFVLGLTCNAMPMYAFPRSTDFDVVGDDGNLVGGGGGSPLGTQPVDTLAGEPVPRIVALVATGSYELESTEFDGASAYAPNDHLTSGAPGDADAGLLKPGEAYVDTIAGVVSDGRFSNENRIEVVRFWSYYLPAMDCGSSSSA